jgi:hypothetical protein
MALIKLGLVFAGIVLLITRGWNLGLVLLLASVAIGLLFGYPLASVGRDAIATSTDLLTVRIAVSVVLIMVLSELLRETGSLRNMVAALQRLVPSGRVVIAALPAFIGLLPMVGGAMFSAPMVNEVGERFNVDQERKTFINYWFRHVWEYVFPLFPSMMLAAALLEMETFQLASATWPLTLAAILSGGVFGLASVRDAGSTSALVPNRARELRALTAAIWPIALAIGLSLTLPVDERARLILGLAVTIALLMIVKDLSLATLGEILRHRVPWKTVAVIFGALIFRRVLDQSGAVHAVSAALIRSRVPPMAIAFLVPFIAGLLTGLSHGAFSIGFPVVLPLAAPDGGPPTGGWAAWMMAGAFLGVMWSPLHLCLSLTRVYFDADWGPIYARIAPATAAVAVTAGFLLLA